MPPKSSNKTRANGTNNAEMPGDTLVFSDMSRKVKNAEGRLVPRKFESSNWEEVFFMFENDTGNKVRRRAVTRNPNAVRFIKSVPYDPSNPKHVQANRNRLPGKGSPNAGRKRGTRASTARGGGTGRGRSTSAGRGVAREEEGARSPRARSPRARSPRAKSPIARRLAARALSPRAGRGRALRANQYEEDEYDNANRSHNFAVD